MRVVTRAIRPAGSAGLRMHTQRVYLGLSMKGAFQPGDVLTVEPVSLSRVRPGDVVVFFRQRGEEQDEIVHRVVRRISGGLVTRGDALAHEDKGVVTESNFVGRVCYKERNGRILIVHGGWLGRCRGWGLHCYWKVRRQGVRIIFPLYDRLRTSGIVSWFWRPRITRLMINSAKGTHIQYICNKRVVARFRPDTGAFECRKPWDLVIGPVEKV